MWNIIPNLGKKFKDIIRYRHLYRIKKDQIPNLRKDTEKNHFLIRQAVKVEENKFYLNNYLVNEDININSIIHFTGECYILKFFFLKCFLFSILTIKMLYLFAWYILTWKSINNIEVNNIVSVKTPESSGVAIS